MKRIETRNPEWYKVGYLYTSQYEPDEKWIIESIEAYHTGLSFPIYYLNCRLITKKETFLCSIFGIKYK